jgi:plastocyanin
VSPGKTAGALAAVVAAGALVVAAPAAAAPVKLTGTVGPGHTIDLRLKGKKVTRLKAGVSYRLTVSDRSEDHDYRMVGPGLSRAITGVEYMGTKTVTVKFRAGSFRFFCAPHADEMRGSFRVVR